MCHNDNRFMKNKQKEKKDKKPCSCQCERKGKKEADILKRKPPIKLNGILIL